VAPLAGLGWFDHPMAGKKNCWVLALGGGRTTPVAHGGGSGIPDRPRGGSVVQIIILANAQIVLQYSVMQVRGRSHRELCYEN
jgi:hypothetical protein